MDVLVSQGACWFPGDYDVGDLDKFLMAGDGRGGDIVDSALETVRRHLGMEIAYLSEFVGNDTVFRAVSAPGREDLFKPGAARSLDEVYCRQIIAGEMPGLIRDTGENPIAQLYDITHAVPVGSHVSVPVRRADGTVYGMFCCLSTRPTPDLTDRDLGVMELFASITAREVDTGLYHRARRDLIVSRTRAAIDGTAFDLHLQPICDLQTRAAVGFEALTRFQGPFQRTPDIWFAEAAEVGLGTELECAVLRVVVRAIDRLPAGLYLSVNASPATVASGAFAQAIAGAEAHRLVLQVTEQSMVKDHDTMAFAVDGLREAGLRIAVDDAGAGYAGLQQILRLRPDIIKLDMSLTRDIDRDAARASLAGALTVFAEKTQAMIVAEGIEREEELAVLRGLGVPLGQGWLLGRPAPLSEVMDRVLRTPQTDSRVA